MGDLGCEYLQIDDISLAYLNDPRQRAYISARGEDPARMHLRYIGLTNGAVAGRPDGMAITTHLCRGNHRSSWVASGGYDYVAEALFNELDVDGFFLEYDDERSGGFEPLRFVPKGNYGSGIRRRFPGVAGGCGLTWYWPRFGRPLASLPGGPGWTGLRWNRPTARWSPLRAGAA
jgi:methionine synthase II (cobalamin-independent)